MIQTSIGGSYLSVTGGIFDAGFLLAGELLENGSSVTNLLLLVLSLIQFCFVNQATHVSVIRFRLCQSCVLLIHHSNLTSGPESNMIQTRC